ncbi:MAG: transposase [Phycisphaeraceae bacterium]|nr:transposase [Phycisphaeraceae bacterium]
MRIVYEGAVYHVAIRGNNRSVIFKIKQDRERFLEKLAESCRLFDIRLYLFCLMSNHAHLVLETPHANLSEFMHRLKTAYTVYFNKRHNQSGHLFQGRFRSSVVDEDEYILKLSRYVHLNPVYVKAHESKSGKERIQVLRDYQWSSYRGYIGQCSQLDYVDYDPVLTMMGGSKKKEQSVYRKFVESGIRDIDAAFIAAKQVSRFCIGSDLCQERVNDRYEDLVKSYDVKEDVSFRREGNLCPVETVLNAVFEILHVKPECLYRRSMNSLVRPLSAYALCHYSGLTQREAAGIMGLHSGAAVSLQIKKLHSDLSLNNETKEILQKLKERLARIKAQELTS